MTEVKCLKGRRPCAEILSKKLSLMGKEKKKKARTTGATFVIKIWRRKPGTFGLGVSQDSPATNPLETAKGFLTLILFFHCFSLALTLTNP